MPLLMATSIFRLGKGKDTRVLLNSVNYTISVYCLAKAVNYWSHKYRTEVYCKTTKNKLHI